MNAFTEGREAATQCKKLDDNPYAQASLRWGAWRDGWLNYHYGW